MNRLRRRRLARLLLLSRLAMLGAYGLLVVVLGSLLIASPAEAVFTEFIVNGEFGTNASPSLSSWTTANTANARASTNTINTSGGNAGFLVGSTGYFTSSFAVLGDVSGNASLYAVVRWFHRRGKVPKRIAHAMQRWTKFLVTSDERILLVNRVAPAVPFTGAFIAVCGWDVKKSLAFIAIGGAAKYAFLLVLVAGLGVAFSPETARLVTLVAVIVLVAASVGAGQYRKRKLQAQTSP